MLTRRRSLSSPGIEARLSLADALRRVGRVKEALPHYDAVLKANASVSQAAFGYSMALVRLGLYQDARMRLSADMNTFSDQPGFAHALARILARRSRRPGARRATCALPHEGTADRGVGRDDGDGAGGDGAVRRCRQVAARRYRSDARSAQWRASRGTNDREPAAVRTAPAVSPALGG